ncbi:hypothetical protein FXO37_23320 [Capsicum annuum]|nr:hypothetical protein FXO37_23320 [Capsicum annuum]
MDSLGLYRLWASLQGIVIQPDRISSSRCSERVVVPVRLDIIQNVLVVAGIIVGIIFELVVLVILMVKKGISLSFVLREIQVLVKLLERRIETITVPYIVMAPVEETLSVDRVYKDYLISVQGVRWDRSIATTFATVTQTIAIDLSIATVLQLLLRRLKLSIATVRAVQSIATVHFLVKDKSGSISTDSSLIDLKPGRFPDHVTTNIFKYPKSMPSFTTSEYIFQAKRMHQVLLVSTKAEFSLDTLLRFHLLAEFDDGK